ncbi:MAG: hypothetical protein M3032_12370 [Verrucomicrobiota bacterium]|nr:hypothetical protein [Verrucomicrobiota bacterium]
MTAQLTGVTNAQQIGVTLSAITAASGQVLPNPVVSMKVLLGDVNGESSTNADDTTIARIDSGQVTNARKNCADLNLDGAIIPLTQPPCAAPQEVVCQGPESWRFEQSP